MQPDDKPSTASGLMPPGQEATPGLGTSGKDTSTDHSPDHAVNGVENGETREDGSAGGTSDGD